MLTCQDNREDNLPEIFLFFICLHEDMLTCQDNREDNLANE